jgi:hypothetical protein
MRMGEALGLYGKRVTVTCADGDSLTGVFNFCQTTADEPDEPESIGIQQVRGIIIDIPIDDVVSMAEEVPA